jgi:transposase
MWSIGLDVHQRWSVICILDENGCLVKERRIVGHWQELLSVLKGLGQPFAICYEASCGYGSLYDVLNGIAARVVVAHPGHLRLIFRSKRKNDRVDARKLAMLLLLNQVPQVHVPGSGIRHWRSLIEFRQRLIDKRVRVKNALRALVRGQGLQLLSGKRLWSKKGLTDLAALELPDTIGVQRDMLLEELKELDGKVVRVTRELDRLGKKHPGVLLLRTIPGVGARTGEAVMAYIDQAERFDRNRQIGCYFGLVPCQDQSADKNRLGHITRQGLATVRKLLTEAAWQGIRRSPQIRSFFERVQGNDPKRKKIALVATAHYLARVMQAMLRTGEVWRHEGQIEEKVA